MAHQVIWNIVYNWLNISKYGIYTNLFLISNMPINLAKWKGIKKKLKITLWYNC